MTTPLRKPVRRVVDGPPITRRATREQLVVTLDSDGIYCRVKGSRTTYGPLSYALLLIHCAKVNATEIVKARRAKRVSRGLLAVGR